MRRRGDVTGLPVVMIDSGLQLGRVKDVVFDFGRGRLTGLVVSRRGRDIFLPFDLVHSLGQTAVTVGAEAVLLPADPAQATPIPKGRRVLTRDGQVLGQVDDVIFDPDSGAVWGYEVTGGFITDFVDGRRAVPLTDEIVIGPDAMVVPEPDDATAPGEGGSEE